MRIGAVYRPMIKRLGLTGNGKLWMDGWCYYKGASWAKKGTGENPTDRAKYGNKRSKVIDGKGVRLGIRVDAASRHDMKMTRATLQGIVVDRLEPTIKLKQHMCMDKGYDFPEVHE